MKSIWIKAFIWILIVCHLNLILGCYTEFRPQQKLMALEETYPVETGQADTRTGTNSSTTIKT